MSFLSLCGWRESPCLTFLFPYKKYNRISVIVGAKSAPASNSPAAQLSSPDIYAHMSLH